MKYSALVLAIASFFAACKSKPIAIAYKTDGKSLLWEVTGNGLTKPTYIYGTMHLMCSGDAKPSKALKTAITNANEIYMEIDMDNLGEIFSMVMVGKMRHDTTLQQLYNADEYARIESFFQKNKLGMQFQAMAKMQPMLVSALVYQVMLNCSEADGVEMEIMKEASPLKKEIKGLETAAFQASLIDNIPYHVQAKDLLSSIDSIEQNKKMFVDMIATYKLGDVDTLAKASIGSGEFNSQEAIDQLLNNRNKNWSEQFGTITKNKSLLIAVGAAHLGGEKGLLNLLKQKGYTLKALVNE